MTGPATFWRTVDVPWGPFSNFFKVSFTIDGKMWPTVEHYYQAQKFKGTLVEEWIRVSKTPKEAAQMGRSKMYTIRVDWDSVRESVMLTALRAKFRQNVALEELLLLSGNRELIEASPYDSYWGWGRDKKGLNRLGKLLMVVREELRTTSGG